ncbi:MAG: hypothetical protein KIT69_17675, partial [Propionibacteriaceae bacterium]|nr:hypothetical protein [Propionibacteriaceae bacterium]
MLYTSSLEFLVPPHVFIILADDVAPSAASGLTLTNPDYNQIGLAWSLSGLEPDVAGFKLYRAAPPASETDPLDFNTLIDTIWFSVGAGDVITLPSDYLVTLPEAALGTSWRYAIRTVDGSLNEGVLSSVVLDDVPPTGPLSVSADLTVTTAIKLDWDDLITTTDPSVYQYHIYRRLQSETDFPTSPIQISTRSTTSWQDSSVSDNTVYIYLIKAVDAAMNELESNDVAGAVCSPMTTPQQAAPKPSITGELKNGVTQSNYELKLTYSKLFDKGVTVTFPLSVTPGNICNYNSLSMYNNDDYTVEQDRSDACQVIATMTAPMATMLGQCGFKQDLDRDINKVYMLQTVQLQTIQSQVVPSIHGNRDLFYDATSSYSFQIVVEFPRQVAALAEFENGEELITPITYSEVITLSALQSQQLVVNSNTNPFEYTFTFVMVLETTFPYHVLLESTDISSSRFDSNTWTFGQISPVCNATVQAGAACRQVFRGSAKLSNPCSTGDVENEKMNEPASFVFSLDCMPDFNGACAPITVEPEIDLVFVSPQYCPKLAEITLSGDIQTFRQVNPSLITADDNSFFGASSPNDVTSYTNPTLYAVNQVYSY